MTAGALGATDYGEAPAVLVFADNEHDRGSAEQAVQAAGARLIAALPIAQAAERLELQAGLTAVVVDVRRDPGPMLDALFDRIDRAARERRYAGVVIVPTGLIDVAAARISHPDVTLLADPEPGQRTAAIAAACAARRLSLHDIGAESGASRLMELSEEVGRIARALASLSNIDDGTGMAERRRGYRGDDSATPEIDAAAIRAIIRARRLREQFFPADLFADPAWDMLLDLMAARIERRGVAVSSLCIAAAVPPTTALRWIRSMTEHLIFIRRADPIDGRRVFIELSDSTAQAMTSYLAAARQIAAVSV